MLKISQRLKAVAAMVPEGSVLADVGTDHGYVPIYLLEQKKIPGAIAMDIRSGPLARAKEHIADYGMGDYIQTRLSDGVAALTPAEADTILVAGMGGGLVMHILGEGEAVCHAAKHIILQPQSELARVRAWLYLRGYVTEQEDMVKEDGKYYPMFRVHYEPDRECQFQAEDEKLDAWIGEMAEEEQLGFYYGSGLLEMRHPVLKEYLHWEAEICKSIEKGLNKQSESERISARSRELVQQKARNREALRRMEME